MVRLRTFSLFLSLWVILLHMMVPHAHQRDQEGAICCATEQPVLAMDLSLPFQQVDLGYRHLELLSGAEQTLALADLPTGIRIPLPPAISPSEWGLPADHTLPDSRPTSTHPLRGPPAA